MLEPPLTAEDFKLPPIALHPDTSQKELDTLFVKNELRSWSKQIKEYEQIEWDQSLFSNDVKIIREEEIPYYLEQTDIPPPGKDPTYIHYITPPFINDNKTALMYSKKWNSGTNITTRYHYFIKLKTKWTLKKTGRLNIGY